MNWHWADRLDQLWRSPFLPIWLLLAIAGFVGLILLVALLRAERSVANGTLAAITLLAIGIVVAIALRDGATPESVSPAPPPQNAASLPALACLDDLAGETVLAACEKLLFSSPDTAAAAVAQTAAQLNRLVARGDVATANRAMTPDLQSLRRAIERDRYGLVAYVLSVRDGCKPEQCAAFDSLTDRTRIAANMTDKIYEAAIARYEPGWGAPAIAAAPVSLMTPTMPTGKPTNTDFPNSASIPPINIMTPEPPLTAPRPAATAPPSTAPKKQPAAPKKQPAAPVQLTPAPSSTAPVARDQ
ncbi:MAG: hypothetical protein JWP21_324 [Tardiphaga sp.]|nr:hypothetical protein [Tardiphaga sp.]